MSDYQLTAYKFARSLSELSSANLFLDPNAFMEVQYYDSDDHKNKSAKTTLGTLDKTVITTYDLFNNLNDIFNPLEHPNETYFPSSTLFEKPNPFIHKENNVPNKNEETLFDSLDDNNLVTKQAIDDYLRNTGICVPVCSPDSNYVYYVPEEHLWKMDNSKKPIVMDYHKDGIWTSESKLKFKYGTNYYYYTDEVVAPKNIMLNVTGNIVLNSDVKDYNKNWYENQHYFVGLTLNGKLATFVFLKNILKIENTTRPNSFYVVAQFHFFCPLAKGAQFQIITNANCKLFGVPDKDQYSRKLYDSLNAVNLAYYDFYGDDIAVSFSENNAARGVPIYDFDTYTPEPKPDIPEFTKSKTFRIEKVWVDGGYEDRRPDEISVELKIGSKTFAKLELSENTTPPWTGEVTLNMPENVDIDAEWDEISGRGISAYTIEEPVIEGLTTTITNKYNGPILYFNPETIEFGNVEEGTSKDSDTSKLYCYRLQGPVHIELQENNGEFELLQDTFEPDENNSIAGVLIPIRFNAPSAPSEGRQIHSAKVVLTSLNASSFTGKAEGYSYSKTMRSKAFVGFGIKNNPRPHRWDEDGNHYISAVWDFYPNGATGNDNQAWNACLYIDNNTGPAFLNPTDLTVITSGTYVNGHIQPNTNESNPITAQYDEDLNPAATFYTKFVVQNYGNPKSIGTIIHQSDVIDS